MVETGHRESANVGYHSDLYVVSRIICSARYLIAAIAAFATAVAVIVAFVLPNIYRAEALLAPNLEEGPQGLSGLADQYAGIASLAGLDLNTGSTDKIALGLSVLQSRRFLSDFIERHDILVPLMASSHWDADTEQLIIDDDIYDVENEEWVRDFSPPRKQVPSRQEAYEEFEQILFVRQDRDTGFVTINVEHYSPVLAKRWVDWLVEDLNSNMRNRDVSRARQAIEYLNKQVNATSLAGMQEVFYRLIEEQTKTVMLAEASPEYLLTTIDDAVVPEIREKPQRALIVLFGAILGVVIGILAQLSFQFYRSNAMSRD